jgi:signal transduction histidine kinase
MRSIRSALLLGTISGSASVFLIVMAVLLYLLRSLIVEHFDSSLHETAQAILFSFEQIPQGLSLELDELDLREFRRDERPAYFEAWLDSGKSIYRSPSLGSGDLDRFSGATGVPEYRWAMLPDGRSGRAVGLALVPRREDDKEDDEVMEPNPLTSAGKRTDHRVTVVVARDSAPIHEPWRRFGTLIGLTGGAAVALSTCVLWVIIRRSLLPLDGVAISIGELDPDELSERIRLSDSPLEVQPIVDRLNDLLGKLEAAFERERGLTSDMAHELRTPLAGIRSTIDVVLLRLRQPEQYQEALDDCRKITMQMQETVEGLLSLARIEAGLVHINPCTLTLEERFQSTWKLLEPTATSRDVQVEWALGNGVPVITDPTLLDIVLRNLLQNAVEYVNDHGKIAIDAAPTPEGLEIRVRNTGSRLTQDQAERVFDRFWRGDAARSNAGVHCGTGLALVRSIASLLGGSARATSQAGAEFEVTFWIPHCPVPSVPPGGDCAH